MQYSDPGFLGTRKGVAIAYCVLAGALLLGSLAVGLVLNGHS